MFICPTRDCRRFRQRGKKSNNIVKLIDSIAAATDHISEISIVRWLFQLLFKAPYARARLDPSAVPSEFENLSDAHNITTGADSSNGKHFNGDHNYCSAREFSTVGATGTSSVTAIDTSTATTEYSPEDTCCDHEKLTTHASPMCLSISTDVSNVDNPLHVVNGSIEESYVQSIYLHMFY